MFTTIYFRFKAPLAPQIHLSFHHHSHRDNVTAPTQLQKSVTLKPQRGGGGGTTRSLRGHVALGKKNSTHSTVIVNVQLLSYTHVSIPSYHSQVKYLSFCHKLSQMQCIVTIKMRCVTEKYGSKFRQTQHDAKL